VNGRTAGYTVKTNDTRAAVAAGLAAALNQQTNLTSSRPSGGGPD